MAKVYTTVEAPLADLEKLPDELKRDTYMKIGLAIAKYGKEAGSSGSPGVPNSAGVNYGTLAHPQFTKNPGALGDSALGTPVSLLKAGSVRWKTPYALRRRFENNRNPHQKNYDQSAWNDNTEEYEEITKLALEEKAFE